eukprot:6976216-Alexandrium_andersonii.AAC.1
MHGAWMRGAWHVMRGISRTAHRARTSASFIEYGAWFVNRLAWLTTLLWPEGVQSVALRVYRDAYCCR